MTTQRLSRLIIALTATIFIAGLLFGESITSAAKPDKSTPTVPKNLVITAVTETTVSLSWGASTDNYGKFSYKVRINNLNNSISAGIDFDFVYATIHGENVFTVKAVDRSGNTSAASAPIRLFLWPC